MDVKGASFRCKGMSASSAARLHCYIKRVYPVLFDDVSKRAEAFRKERGYEAPRWALADFAEQAVREHRETKVLILLFQVYD